MRKQEGERAGRDGRPESGMRDGGGSVKKGELLPQSIFNRSCAIRGGGGLRGKRVGVGACSRRAGSCT